MYWKRGNAYRNVEEFQKSLKLIKPSMSLAGVESTILMPTLTSHTSLTEEEIRSQDEFENQDKNQTEVTQQDNQDDNQIHTEINDLGCKLHCIKLQETENNSVEYSLRRISY